MKELEKYYKQGFNLKLFFNNNKIDVDIVNTIVSYQCITFILHINTPTTFTKIKKLEKDIDITLKTYNTTIQEKNGNIYVIIPNVNRQVLYFNNCINDVNFTDKKDKKDLYFLLGRDLCSNIVIQSLARMPHLLIGGASGAR